MGRRNQAESYLNVHAFDVWTTDMAYALGLFYADGGISRKNPESTWRVSFVNTDQRTVEWWHVFLTNTTKIGVVEPASNRPLQRQIAYTSTATSDYLGQRLNDLGAVPRKSWADMCVPDMPETCIPHFVRGFLDGDGGIWMANNANSKGGKNLLVSLASNSKTFREGLRKCLLTQGLQVSEDGINIRLSGSFAEKLCQWVYGVGGQRMERKYQIWQDWQAFRDSHGGLAQNFDRNAHAQRGVQSQDWHSLCGTRPDPEIAEMAGVPTESVYYARKVLHIPAYITKYGSGVKFWHKWVGTMKDTEVAKLGGVSPSVVCVYRKKNGIPVYSQIGVTNV